MGLGRETDLFLIDLDKGNVYNFGFESSIDEVQAFVGRIVESESKLEPAYFNVKARAKRFLIISGLELGYNLIKGRTIEIYSNPRVRKMSKYIASSD